MTQNRSELLRYGAVILLGLAVDLSAARALFALGLPLEASAAAGVACGAALNYLLLEYWAFRGPKAGHAAARPLRYLGALGATMAVRAGAVWALEAAAPPWVPPLAILGGGVGVSFFANFLLSKYWVFRRDDAPGPAAGDRP